MSFFIETAIKRTQMLREWRKWVNMIASVVREIIPSTEVYVVGSVVIGESTGGSDVDILIVSEYAPEKPRERSRLKSIIEEKLSLPYYHPFEIHVLKPEEAECYLSKAKGSIFKIY